MSVIFFKPSAFLQFNSINNVIYSSPPSVLGLTAQYTDSITHIDELTQKGKRKTSQDLQMLLPVTLFGQILTLVIEVLKQNHCHQ